MIVVCTVLAVALVATLLAALRARAAERSARGALDAERRARVADAAAAAGLREQMEAAHRDRLGDLERATREKVELLTGGRAELRREMQAISSDVLKGATEQITKLAAEARRADHAAAKGELGLRAAEIKEAVAPIAKHLERVGSQVEQLERDRAATHATSASCSSRRRPSSGGCGWRRARSSAPSSARRSAARGARSSSRTSCASRA